MPKYAKGSPEMAEFMKKVRAAKQNKKGMGFLGDVLKSGAKMVKNEIVNRVPLPSIIKDPVSGVLDKGIDYGISKTGLGVVKRKYNKRGAALNLP
jgi:hypothetical protein